jgi:glycerol uptake facilitator protein
MGYHLSLGTTGYAINPARDLPRIMHAILPVKGSSDWSYAWIPLRPIVSSHSRRATYGITMILKKIRL